MPETRIESIVKSLDFAMDILLCDDVHCLHNKHVLNKSDGETIEVDSISTLYIPILVRVLRIVDLSETEVKEIYSKLFHNYRDEIINLLSAHNYFNLDYEMLYCKAFADEIINQKLK